MSFFSFQIASELPLLLPAYIDPAAGGMLIQVILGGIAGLLVVMKLYWKRLVRVLRGGPEDPPPAPAQNAEPEPTAAGAGAGAGAGEARE